MTAAAETVDVAIVGGGLVGCSLAVALRRQGRSVLLVEAQAPRFAPPAWDERCIALNAASRQILEAFGLWQDLAAQAEPIRATHVSERGRFGAVRFSAEEAGLPALGYNTPLRTINQALWHAVERNGTVLRSPARLEALRVEDDAVTLDLSGAAPAPPVRTRLLVAADGARSAVREQLGFGAEVRDYGQSALVSAVRVQHPHRGVAYERFLPTGPLALLPKPDDAAGQPACSLVWTLPGGQIDDWLALDAATFLERANEAFGERLGRLSDLGARAAYPLQRVMNERLTAPRTAFIGNAAQSLHPVAAQGFNLGLRDAAALAGLLQDQTDPGTESLLGRYAAERAPDRARVSGFTDHLVRLFSNRLPGLAQLRHLGLLALELDTPVRRAVLQQNLGLSRSLAGLRSASP